MALRLLKVEDGNRVNTILLDAEVERVIPLFREGKEFTIDMSSEGVNPKSYDSVLQYLCEVHIPENVGATGQYIGSVGIVELKALATYIAAGAGF